MTLLGKVKVLIVGIITNQQNLKKDLRITTLILEVCSSQILQDLVVSKWEARRMVK